MKNRGRIASPWEAKQALTTDDTDEKRINTDKKKRKIKMYQREQNKENEIKIICYHAPEGYER